MAAKSTIRSEGGKVRRVIVVGGGLAGLMTVIKLCEARVPVDLISLVPVKRSHSVCAQGGINASVNTKGEGDSPKVHLEETAYGGDFLGNQPPIKGMADAAPGIVYMLDRMGVPFNRTAEGLLDFRRFGGTLFHRTAFAGATTGQQLLYALDEQVRRWETQEVVDEHGVAIPGERMVRKFEFWDFLEAVLDDNGVCVGCVAQDLKTMQIRHFPGDAVVLATGGCGIIFGRSTLSVICTGTAAASVYKQGAVYANGEFIQVHQTAIPGASGSRRTRATSATRARSPRRTGTTSSSGCTPATVTSCRATSPRAPSSRPASTRGAASTTPTRARTRTRSTSTSRTRTRSSSAASSRASSRSTRSSSASTRTRTR
jgi:succinate dehydrogenase / fumarate reductase flavoprotein subunit